MDQETLLNAQAWFENYGYETHIEDGLLYLQLDGFSVELSQSEIENRAEQSIR